MSRPRSVHAHQQVLEAALKLFAERGIERTSMDAIAESSGVSKATIYKHWDDKDALCLEVMAYVHGLDQPPPVFDSGDLREDLVAALSHRPAERNLEMHNRMMPRLLAYAAENRAFGQRWRKLVMEPGRDRFTQLLKRGIREGILSPDLDVDAGVAMLIGPMLYRNIFSEVHGSLPEDLPRHIVNAFLKSYAVAKRRRRAVKQNP